MSWRDALPEVRGKLLRDEPLGPYTWFRVGGAADQPKPVFARDPGRQLPGGPRIGNVTGMCHHIGRGERELEQPSSPFERAAHRDHRISGRLGLDQHSDRIGAAIVDSRHANITCPSE